MCCCPTCQRQHTTGGHKRNQPQQRPCMYSWSPCVARTPACLDACRSTHLDPGDNSARWWAMQSDSNVRTSTCNPGLTTRKSPGPTRAGVLNRCPKCPAPDTACLPQPATACRIHRPSSAIHVHVTMHGRVRVMLRGVKNSAPACHMPHATSVSLPPPGTAQTKLSARSAHKSTEPNTCAQSPAQLPMPWS